MRILALFADGAGAAEGFGAPAFITAPSVEPSC
jgi:hypothetical protein